MLEFKYDVQLLIEGENLSEDEINEYIVNNMEGDWKLYFHQGTPTEMTTLY